jgi:hypothetical protein
MPRIQVVTSNPQVSSLILKELDLFSEFDDLLTDAQLEELVNSNPGVAGTRSKKAESLGRNQIGYRLKEERDRFGRVQFIFTLNTSVYPTTTVNNVILLSKGIPTHDKASSITDEWSFEQKQGLVEQLVGSSFHPPTYLATFYSESQSKYLMTKFTVDAEMRPLLGVQQPNVWIEKPIAWEIYQSVLLYKGLAEAQSMGLTERGMLHMQNFNGFFLFNQWNRAKYNLKYYSKGAKPQELTKAIFYVLMGIVIHDFIMQWVNYSNIPITDQFEFQVFWRRVERFAFGMLSNLDPDMDVRFDPKKLQEYGLNPQLVRSLLTERRFKSDCAVALGQWIHTIAPWVSSPVYE